MNHLIIVRHGQSIWNLEKRFTGWVDVGLTGQGNLEACKAGELIKKLDLNINHLFSSYQKRAIDAVKYFNQGYAKTIILSSGRKQLYTEVKLLEALLILYTYNKN